MCLSMIICSKWSLAAISLRIIIPVQAGLRQQPMGGLRWPGCVRRTEWYTWHCCTPDPGLWVGHIFIFHFCLPSFKGRFLPFMKLKVPLSNFFETFDPPLALIKMRCLYHRSCPGKISHKRMWYFSYLA